jgi:hypothetical protein
MPPHFPVEDNSFETKEWASATIDTLFSDNHPITFEPCRPIQIQEPIVKSVHKLKESSSNNPARRSLSMLETRLFNRQSNDNAGRPWARSIQSSDTTVTLAHSDSAPSLLISQHQRSFPSRFKRSTIPEKPPQRRTMTVKEKEGIDIWKNTFSQYLADADMVSSLKYIYI